jgi:hypothetical protein
MTICSPSRDISGRSIHPPNQGGGRKSPAGYPEVYIVSNVLDGKGEPIGALGDGEQPGTPT